MLNPVRTLLTVLDMKTYTGDTVNTVPQLLGGLSYRITLLTADVEHVHNDSALVCTSDDERLWKTRSPAGEWDDDGTVLSLPHCVGDVVQESHGYTYERGLFAVEIISSEHQVMTCGAWKSGAYYLDAAYMHQWQGPFMLGPGCIHAVCRFEGSAQWRLMDVDNSFAESAQTYSPVWPQAEVRFVAPIF